MFNRQRKGTANEFRISKYLVEPNAVNIKVRYDMRAIRRLFENLMKAVKNANLFLLPKGTISISGEGCIMPNPLSPEYARLAKKKAHRFRKRPLTAPLRYYNWIFKPYRRWQIRLLASSSARSRQFLTPD